MLVSKLVRSSTIVALLALGAAACSDGLTAPVAEAPSLEPGDALMAKGGNSGSQAGRGRGKEQGSRTFTIYPGSPVFERFGDHTLTMPANAVCDPTTSGYGSAHFDKPCQPANSPIAVTATWEMRGGTPVISFSPDLRFAPSPSPKHWVHLSLWDRRGIDASLYYTILWYDAGLGRWVDESKDDPTLKARVSFDGSLVTRRLKHFSMYGLWAGFGSYNVTSGMGDDFGLGGW